MAKTCCKCKENKLLKDFNKNRCRKDGYQTMCRECERLRRQAYYRDNVDKYLGYNKRRQEKIRKWFINLKKSLKCEMCYEDRWYMLHFHHLNQAIKEGEVSNIFKNTLSVKKISKEIESCQVLCANCHAEVHFLERNGT